MAVCATFLFAAPAVRSPKEARALSLEAVPVSQAGLAQTVTLLSVPPAAIQTREVAWYLGNATAPVVGKGLCATSPCVLRVAALTMDFVQHLAPANAVILLVGLAHSVRSPFVALAANVAHAPPQEHAFVSLDTLERCVTLPCVLWDARMATAFCRVCASAMMAGVAAHAMLLSAERAARRHMAAVPIRLATARATQMHLVHCTVAHTALYQCVRLDASVEHA